jgi:hypothetical protein
MPVDWLWFADGCKTFVKSAFAHRGSFVYRNDNYTFAGCFNMDGQIS